ncbi:MAG: CoA-binding protein [Candidatus Zixiibacteriota bacterium]|nr:MAG: CoA-binding protein [candidate division Zixibacteria bacterium]
MTRAPAGSSAVVLGASPKEDRYSFKAVNMLKDHGFRPIPVHPAGHAVSGITALKSLDDVNSEIDTLTVYVSAKVSDSEYDRIIKLGPRRVIFNPGAENKDLAARLAETGIEVVEACTLVMLRTDQY